VAAALANQFEVHVRTGGPNAGHTFYHDHEKFVARSIPCGWINPDALLLVGPGAVIDLEVFKRELQEINDRADVAERLTVDYRATVISHSQHQGEGGVHGVAHREIGSTGEGVGLARMSRINRDTLISTDISPFAHIRAHDRREEFESMGVQVEDVASILHSEIEAGAEVLLEGTQGCGLSMTLGPWPYCTSADTNAAQLASDAGISPSDVKETVLVARTYPIRVAGKSGPLWSETTWEEVGQKPETTTVTKKVRRVGLWNDDQVRQASRVNHPALLVITFLDYIFPETAGIRNWRALPQPALDWLIEKERLLNLRVIGVGTGPDSYCPIGQLGAP
jgi:adenylosuccinate synthase